MGLRDTFLNVLGADTRNEVQKTSNYAHKSARDFLRYGNREKLYPTWSEIKMPDQDMYRGYSYAVIQKRGNKVATLAKENLKTWANPEIVDEFQKKNETVEHPYLKLIEDSTKFTEKQFWKNISIYLDLAGRYYLGVVRSEIKPLNPKLPIITTDPTEFIMLNPYEIRRVIDRNGHVAGYIERKKDGRYREWPLHQIIEMRELNPFDPENSQWAMTDAAKSAVYTMNQSSDYTVQSLHGNIEAPGIITTDVLLADEDFENFRRRVSEHTKGEPLFGNGAGAIQWESMQIDLDKAALMDINEINRTTLFAVSGTSKTSLGIEQSGTTRETARVQSEQFVSDTAQPRLEDIVDFLNLDYKKHYNREYKQTGYYIEIKSAVGTDYATETQAVGMRQAQVQLAMQLMQSGYTMESAYQFAEGEIELSDLELEKGVDKPQNPESDQGDEPTDGGDNPTDNNPQSPNTPTASADNEKETENSVDLNELEPHQDLVENGGKGSGNFGHSGRLGKVGGSSSTNNTTLSEDTVNAIAENYADDITLTVGKENEFTRALAEEQSFLDQPQKVSQEEYDKAIQNGGLELFRGVKRNSNMTVGEMVDEFVNGEAWYGNGDFGAGIYTTSILNIASEYTGEFDNGEGLMKMVLPKDAKILKYTDNVRDEFFRYRSDKVNEYLGKSKDAYEKNDSANGEKYDRLVKAYDSMNFTDYAIINGYDAFDASHDRGIFVVLNRKKLLTVKGEPTVKFDDEGKRNNSVDKTESSDHCSCSHDHKIETYINRVSEQEGKVINETYKAFLEEIQKIEKETVNAVATKLTINAFAQDDLLGKRKRANLLKKLKNAVYQYWWALLPMFAANTMNKRNKEFGEDQTFTFTNDIQSAVDRNADRVAEGHLNTILDDILEATNKAYTDVSEQAAADLIVEAYQKTPTRFGDYFHDTPTKADALEAVQKTDILEKNRRIYEEANKMAYEGFNRQDIIKAIKNTYKDISKKRANTIARNETARAFTQSQFEADKQFLNSVGKMENAYKVLYSRRPDGAMCPYCQELIRQSNENPIPFEQPFLKFGESIEVWDNGKTKTFTANYEDIQGGVVHPNCQCDYHLVFKNDAGEFVKTLNGGKGSGNFGHAGRPGEVGGSAPNGSVSESRGTRIGLGDTVEGKDSDGNWHTGTISGFPNKTTTVSYKQWDNSEKEIPVRVMEITDEQGKVYEIPMWGPSVKKVRSADAPTEKPAERRTKAQKEALDEVFKMIKCDNPTYFYNNMAEHTATALRDELSKAKEYGIDLSEFTLDKFNGTRTDARVSWEKYSSRTGYSKLQLELSTRLIADGEGFATKQKMNYDKNWHTADDIAGIVRHELGHIKAYQIAKDSGVDIWNTQGNYGRGRFSDWRYEAVCRQIIKKAIGNAGYTKSTDTKRGDISEYGGTNVKEAIAEAFSNPDYSDFTKKVVKTMMDKNLKIEVNSLNEKVENKAEKETPDNSLCSGYPMSKEDWEILEGIRKEPGEHFIQQP